MSITAADERRSLAVQMRALLVDAAAAGRAYDEAMVRSRPGDNLDGIALKVAGETRRSGTFVPFGDDLFKQLADVPVRTVSSKALAEVWGQLPPPERELLRRRYDLGMDVAQIAETEGRPVAAVAREYHALHTGLVARLLDDRDPAPPPNAADLGRLAVQLLDGTISEDGRLVLETLLLADHAAQSHYLRHIAVVCELGWRFHPLADYPTALLARLRPTSVREWVVTVSFLVAAAGAIAYLVAFLVERLGN